MMLKKSAGPGSRAANATLERDAVELNKAVSDLVRLYQFRDRKRIYYYDLSVTQCYALGALIAKQGMTQGELARQLYLDKSTTSRVIDSLERKGYVQRLADPHDGRALNLALTEAGQRVHARIVHDLEEEMKQLITDFDPDVRQATVHLVARLARAARERFSRFRQEEPDEV